MSERRVPVVIYQGGRKLVNVNFSSFENAVSSIGNRLNITDIKLHGKRSENEEYFDIEDDGDLEGLEDVEGLVLLVKDLSLDDGGPSRQQRGEGDQATGRTSSCQDFLGEKDTASLGYRGSSSASVADEAGGSPYSPSGVAPGMRYQGYPIASGDGMPYAVPVYDKPPEYAESEADRSLRLQSAKKPAPRSQANTSEAKITAIYGEKTKKIVVERSNFEAIRNLIANRFKLQDDFQLQIKDESGDMIDIDSDGDATDNIELMHTIWVIPTDPMANKAKITAQDKITVIYGEKTKKIAVERSNFEAIHKRIADGFKLPGDFQLQVRDGAGDMIDIDSDEDAADNEKSMHTVWVTIPVVKPVVTEDMSLVVVDEVKYSITETLDNKSQIVLKAAETLRRDICIPSISAKLNEVEECLRIAYYASMEIKEIHKKTQTMQFHIQKLCAECDTTMLKIKLKAADILNELQCGFGYLLEGFEDFGLERLGAVGPIAVEIQKDVASLKTLLESEEFGVHTLGQVSYQDKDAIAAEEERKRKEVEIRRQRVYERSQEVHQSESQISSLAERELSAVQAAKQHLKSDSGIGFGFKKLITLGYYKGNKSRAEQEERLAGEMREEQARESERLAELKEEEERTKIEFDKLVASIKGPPKQMSDAAVQGAESGISTLTSFMKSLEDFWKKNGAEFNSVNNTKFLDNLKEYSDPEERKKFWTSKRFRIEAMNYVARFVAIQAMCEQFHETMTKVLDDIHRCIRDNPTPAEAKAKLPKLLQQFKEQ